MSATDIAFDESTLVPINVKTLCISDDRPFDLYFYPPRERGRLRLYRQRAHAIADSDLHWLAERNVRTLYVAQRDSDSYRGYFYENILGNDALPAVYRYGALRHVMRDLLTEALLRCDHESIKRVTRQVSEAMVHTVCDSEIVLKDLLSVMSHASGIFNHAMNVATNCLLLAKRLGIHRNEELLQIGQGALLHDIGMRNVPPCLLEEPEKATQRERHDLREHPTRGFKELLRCEGLTWGQLMMVYSHHERYDGRGYPANLLQSEIHEYARICAIADAHDTLSRPRANGRAPRRRAITDHLDRMAGQAFDKEMVRCWTSTIAKTT